MVIMCNISREHNKKMRIYSFFALFSLACVASTPLFAAESHTPQTEIIYRANLGRADDIKLLLKDGADANQKDDKGTPLICLAAGRADEESANVITVLLAAGADINAKDRGGQNALFYAARRNNVIVTPHIGGCTLESMRKTEEFLAQKVAEILEGELAGVGSQPRAEVRG